MAGVRKEVKPAARAMRMVPGGNVLVNTATKMRRMSPGSKPATTSSPRSKPQEAAVPRPKYEDAIRKKYATPAEQQREAARVKRRKDRGLSY